MQQLQKVGSPAKESSQVRAKIPTVSNSARNNDYRRQRWERTAMEGIEGRRKEETGGMNARRQRG